MSLKIKAVRLAMFATLGLTMAFGTGCPGDECTPETVAEDCGEGFTCNADNKCEEITDLCAGKICPGGQTCDADTGDCTGDCCTATSCPDFRFECDEARCLAGESNVCVAKECDPACGEGEVCNVRMDPPQCEQACLTEGCPANFTCDSDLGCVKAPPPEPGDVGYVCDSDNDCAAGNFCVEWQDPDLQKWCSRLCENDDECPSGSFCLEEVGICFDACDTTFMDDCGPDLQCVSEEGFADYCWPIFPESECTGDCLPAGSACDPAIEDQCEAGLACIEWSNGATCAELGCGYRMDACDEGFTCENLGSNLSACIPSCDPTDPDACEEGVSCVGNTPITTTDNAWFLAQDAADCVAPYDNSIDISADLAGLSEQLGLEGDTWFVCYAGCASNDDCAFGETCFPTLFVEGGDPVGLCGVYDVVQGACPDACGDADCTDAGQGFAYCYTGCTADADCGTELGSTCSNLGPFAVCMNQWQTASCLPGCSTNTDCGFCQSDADCPQGQVAYDAQGNRITYDEVCDFATNMCVVTTPAACSQYEEINPNGYTDAQGNVSGACASPCDSDIDCAGACGADGFCVVETRLCNGPTGQCEVACADGAECLHGACAANDVDSYGRCVLGCDGTSSCGEGFCDTSAEPNYCILGCQTTGCEDGASCNDTTGFCVADPAFTTATAAGDDVLADGTAAVDAGTVTIAWEATDATSVTLATGDVPTSGNCADATFTDVAGAPTTATGSHDLDVTTGICARLTADGEFASTETIFEITVNPV